MTRILASSVALAAVMSAPAFAGNIEPVVVEPPLAPAPVFSAPTYNWTGFYAGISAGYVDGDATATGLPDPLDDDGDGDFNDGTLALSDDGGFVGLRLGYDYDFGGFLLGAAASYDRLDLDLGGGVQVDDVMRLGVRAGIPSGRNLYYATAGLARADTNIIGSADGYYAGLGYEVFLNENITLGAEALYHEFDDFDGAGVLNPVPGAAADAEATTVGLNVNFRF